MKRILIIFSFVFAITSLSAQTKKKIEPKEKPIQTPIQVVPTLPQIYNFQIEIKTLNLIIMGIRSSTELDANTSNELVKFLTAQANDTTLNKRVPIPKGQ